MKKRKVLKGSKMWRTKNVSSKKTIGNFYTCLVTYFIPFLMFDLNVFINLELHVIEHLEFLKNILIIYYSSFVNLV